MPLLNWGLCWKHLRHTSYAVSRGSAGTRWISSSAPRLAGRSRHIITLRPSQMVHFGQEVHDLSGMGQASYRVKDTSIPLRYLPVTTIRRMSFPEGSKGVLYYHHEEHRPAWDAEIRFRLCDDVSMFDSGKDLQLPENGGPWVLPLYLVAAGHIYKGLRSQLKEDNVVDGEIIDALHAQRYELPTGHNPLTQILYDFADPFFIDLSIVKPLFWYISPNRSARFSISPFTRTYGDNLLVAPFVGKVRVRFVPAPMVLKTEDANAFYLQVLDIISPVQCVLEDYDYSILRPQVGELVTRKKTGFTSKKYSAWVYDLVKERERRQYAPLTRARRFD